MAAAAALGWYGPLIDLSNASSHVGHFVQLLVFVHRSTPLQFRQSKGGDVIRTDVQVGDDTTPFFSLTLWGNAIPSAVAADVKIGKYGSSIEAKTVQESSVVRLVHSFQSLISKGIDDVLKDCRIGTTAKEKLLRVMEWVRKVKPTVCSAKVINSTREAGLHVKNWKEHEVNETQHCSSLVEVMRLDISCKATFFASVGEIFLPFAEKLNAMDTERMFLSRRIYEMPNHHLAEDLICTGCQLCGSPLGLDSSSFLKKTNVPLYCPRSSDKLHVISSIYKPFMLYVWDEMEYIPILVKNTAATILFGNIKAERVYTSYKSESLKASSASQSTEQDSAGSKNSSKGDAKTPASRKPHILSVWLILLKLLLKQGENGPMKFEVDVNIDQDKENGRFEMISVSFPCSSLM